MHDVHIGAHQALRQSGREGSVDLHRRQLRDGSTQEVGGHAWSGPDLQDVVTQVAPVERPRKDLPLHGFGPFSAGTELEVALVHNG